jgi:glyoxylate reductase
MAALPRIVVTRRIFPELIDELRTQYDLLDNQDDGSLGGGELQRRLADADGALTTPGERIDEALLGGCPKLKVVSNVAVGYNNIDLAACTKLGIVATNTPDVLTESTADHAWALLLAAARRVGETDRWIRAGQWKRTTFEMYMGAEIHGSTLGIVGLGRIGRAIARRAQGFGLRAVYHNRKRLPTAEEGGAQWLPLDELLRTADHVMLVVPYSPATHHLIGAAQLAQMKRTAVLVNIARGGVVDDAALIAALRAGTIAAAGLDVFENEPKLDPGFLTLDNAVLTPHIASATYGTRTGMARSAMTNLAEALAGRRPPALLNPEVWDRRRR